MAYGEVGKEGKKRESFHLPVCSPTAGTGTGNNPSLGTQSLGLNLLPPRMVGSRKLALKPGPVMCAAGPKQSKSQHCMQGPGELLQGCFPSLEVKDSFSAQRS